MKKGFTLIEIIIAIVLISLLGTTSIIVLNKPSDKTYDTALKRAMDAVNVYINTEKDSVGNTYFNGIYKGGEGLIVPLRDLNDKGYINDSDYDVLIKKLADDKEYFVVGFKSQDECESGVEINLAGAEGFNKSTYICGFSNNKGCDGCKEPEDGSIFKKIINMEYTTNCSKNTGTGLCYLHGKDISEDDKDIWYFKGNVENNYLKFNGSEKKYRIVRTVENGGIKIIDSEVLGKSVYDYLSGIHRFITKSERRTSGVSVYTAYAIISTTNLADGYYLDKFKAGPFDRYYKCGNVKINNWNEQSSEIECKYEHGGSIDIEYIKNPLYDGLYIPLKERYDDNNISTYIDTDYKWCATNYKNNDDGVSFKCDSTKKIASNFFILNIGEYDAIQYVEKIDGDDYQNYIYGIFQSAWPCDDEKELGIGKGFFDTYDINKDDGSRCESDSYVSIRPAYVIKGNSKIIDGDGTSSNPFVIDGFIN